MSHLTLPGHLTVVMLVCPAVRNLYTNLGHPRVAQLVERRIDNPRQRRFKSCPEDHNLLASEMRDNRKRPVMRPYPPDGGLKEPVRPFDNTVWDVILDHSLPDRRRENSTTEDFSVDIQNNIE